MTIRARTKLTIAIMWAAAFFCWPLVGAAVGFSILWWVMTVILAVGMAWATHSDLKAIERPVAVVRPSSLIAKYEARLMELRHEKAVVEDPHACCHLPFAVERLEGQIGEVELIIADLKRIQ